MGRGAAAHSVALLPQVAAACRCSRRCLTQPHPVLPNLNFTLATLATHLPSRLLASQQRRVYGAGLTREAGARATHPTCPAREQLPMLLLPAEPVTWATTWWPVTVVQPMAPGGRCPKSYQK